MRSTIGPSATRRSAATGFAALLALAVAFVPRDKSPLQVAALGGAVLIAVELATSHWFYLYVVWFAPLALVALMGGYRTAVAGQPPPARL